MVKIYELGKKEPVIDTDKILNEVMEEIVEIKTKEDAEKLASKRLEELDGIE